MKFHKPTADLFVPDRVEPSAALKRTTHMGIGAHQDDLEIWAVHGILECFGRADQWFTGVTCTDGAGSARTGVYANCTDEDMKRIRREEQKTAASVGRYSAVIQLDYSSKEIKSPASSDTEDDLFAILSQAHPQVVYTHNPADKHATHVAVMHTAIRALRRLPAAARPEKVYGCEAWRDLDWLPDEKKVVLDLGNRSHLAAALTALFDSQIAGGKRYDLATQGRYRANATYFSSHSVDTMEAATFAMDLTPLMEDDSLEIGRYVAGLMDEFKQAVLQQIKS